MTRDLCGTTNRGQGHYTVPYTHRETSHGGISQVKSLAAQAQSKAGINFMDFVNT